MNETKTSSSKIIFWLLFVVFIWIAVTYFVKTEQILRVLTQGKWYWILPALLCQLFYYPFYSYFVGQIFKIFHVNIATKEIIPVYIASKFTDIVLPIATLGEVAIFIRRSKRMKSTALNIGIGIVFSILFEVLAFLILSFFTLIILYIFGDFRSYLLIALLILTAFMLLVVLFLMRITQQRKPLYRFFLWVIKIILRLAGQKSIEMPEIERIIIEIGNDLKTGKDKIWPGLKLAIITHLINLATFAFIYLAFAGNFNLFGIMAGYVACLLFTIVSITPQGVGVAEVVMIKTLQSFGLDLSVAAVITLAFRGLLYWLPFFAGFYVFSHLELRKE